MALRQRVPAIVGAGWEPGALSVFRHLFQVLAPKGYTETTYRPGISLHHSAWVRSLQGVKDALCAEPHSAASGTQRYVYVEFEAGADETLLSMRSETMRSSLTWKHLSFRWRAWLRLRRRAMVSWSSAVELLVAQGISSCYWRPASTDGRCPHR
jgi:hypothetical protein